MARVTYTHNGDVAAVAKRVAREGGTKQEAFNKSLGLQECPASYNTWNKIYGNDFANEATDVKLRMTNKAQAVVEKHMNADSLEAAKFVLERKGGWNKTDINVEAQVEVSPEEELGVKEKLAEALGKRGLFISDPDSDKPDETET